MGALKRQRTTWGKEEGVRGLVGTGMISLGSAAGCVSVSLGRFSDACSWHSSRPERVALTGLVGRARQAVDAVWVRMCLCSGTVCWLNSLLLFFPA